MPVDVPTFDELYQAGKDEITSRQTDLTDWNEGSALDAVTGGAAALADEVIATALKRFADLFIDTAEGDALDALALDRYGTAIARQEATAAVGTLRFTRGSSVGDLLIPAGTEVSGTVNGETVSVTTDADATMPAASNTLDVAATCTETGTAGNIAASVLTNLVDAIPGDADATVTNPARCSGGAAEETDDAFRDRLRRAYTSAQRGTVAALETGALNVDGVTFAVIDESDVATAGVVRVYVGDSTGTGNDALADAVAEELEDWRAAGIRIEVSGMSTEDVAVTLAVIVVAGANQSVLDTAIRAAVDAFSDALEPSETLYLQALACAAQEVSDDILSVRVTTPAVDTAPSAASKAIRLIPITIGFTEEA